MLTKDWLQLTVSAIAPFMAAGVAVWIAAAQRRELVSCFILWDWHDGEDLSILGVHNRSAQPIAVIAVRYRAGIVLRSAAEGTALDYEDPTDLPFPLLVPPGEIKRMRLYGVTEIYTDDAGLAKRAKMCGITPIGIGEVPIPDQAKQIELELEQHDALPEAEDAASA